MTRWVMAIIIANVAVFLLQGMRPELTAALMWLPAAGLARPWTAVTYMFLHGGFGHILFNMLALYIFGPRLEARIGGLRFLGLYLVSGLAGAAACYYTPNVPVIGASGAVLGVSLAYARYWPTDVVLIYGILPMTTRMMVVVYALLSVGGAIFGFQQGVSHLGHLGGLLGGWFFCVWMERFTGARYFRQRAETGWTAERKGAIPVPTAIVELAVGDRESLARWARIQPGQLHPVNREELERIRAKITADGVRSLTALEREFMERFAALAG
ncbi:MAG: rhomboid family intramembrane serine protease [Gemmatimonadales bacterium]